MNVVCRVILPSYVTHVSESCCRYVDSVVEAYVTNVGGRVYMRRVASMNESCHTN